MDRHLKSLKVRKMGFHELRVRGSQALAAFAERRGWSSQTRLPNDLVLLGLLDPDRCGPRKLRSATEFLEHFQRRTKPKFFAAFDDREGTLTELRKRWPEAESEIIAQADRISEGRFDVLGLHDLSFGDPIDWHLEPVSGKHVPSLHWSRLNYLDADVSGDKKILWELNRQQYFAKLGQAYWLTREERYAETFTNHIKSWMDQNPPKLGINWASSLEVAFRSISWVWALHFFKESPALTANIFLRALKFLYLNARHLETYLSTYFSPNTHLTGEALGLFYLGALFPEFKEAERWRDTGITILVTQLNRHVRPDGVYFEQSSYYHRYTTDFYTHLLILLGSNSAAIPAALAEKLQLLLDHLMYLTRPDGTTPLFGDDDGGRLVMIDRRPANDFRAALSTGAALFTRPDYKYVGGEAAEETLWLLGVDGLREFDRIQPAEPSKQSVAFADGGYYVMRDGWTPTSNYLLFDCGPHGADNCGHAHADALAIELAAYGRTLLVDPGTCTYTGSPETRDWFRSSPAHNTLTVDGESSSVPAGPFSWKTVAQCKAVAWIGRKRFDYLEGRHDGYERLAEPATHSRSILFLKNDYWMLRDRVRSSGEHRVELWFHFDGEATPRIETSEGEVQTVAESGNKAGVRITTFANSGSWRREEASVSHCYGERTAAPVYVFSAISQSCKELITLMLPQRCAQSSKATVREIEAIGGRAFEIIDEHKADIVMTRSFNGNHAGHRVETARLASDFEWTWVRFSGESATVPDELVVIGGQTLELEGREILKSGRRINYLVAGRVGDQFRVETDDGVLDLALPIKDFDSVFSSPKSQIDEV
jgi:hypothetical protein